MKENGEKQTIAEKIRRLNLYSEFVHTLLNTNTFELKNENTELPNKILLERYNPQRLSFLLKLITELLDDCPDNTVPINFISRYNLICEQMSEFQSDKILDENE